MSGRDAVGLFAFKFIMAGGKRRVSRVVVVVDAVAVP